MDLPNHNHSLQDTISLSERIARIEQLLLDNKIHESFCPAHSTAADAFAGSFISLTQRECVCWISLDPKNSLPEHHGWGIYDLKTETLWKVAFTFRAYAFQHLMEQLPDLTTTVKDENYWGRKFVIVEVAPQTEENATENP